MLVGTWQGAELLKMVLPAKEGERAQSRPPWQGHWYDTDHLLSLRLKVKDVEYW